MPIKWMIRILNFPNAYKACNSNDLVFHGSKFWKYGCLQNFPLNMLKYDVVVPIMACIGDQLTCDYSRVVMSKNPITWVFWFLGGFLHTKCQLWAYKWI